MNLHETAMGQRFFNVQLPALINTLKDIAAALSRPAPDSTTERKSSASAALQRGVHRF